MSDMTSWLLIIVIFGFKLEQMCNNRYPSLWNQTEYFKNYLCSALSSLHGHPQQPLIFLLSPSCAFSRTSYNWSDTVCSLRRLVTLSFEGYFCDKEF